MNIYFSNVNYIGNVGDYWSSPLKYYNFDFEYKHIHLMDIAYNRIDDIKNSIFVIGGGGLINESFSLITKAINKIIKNNFVIFWGIGGSSNYFINFNILNHPNVKLIGIRDIDYNFNFNNNYLPCVSCKNSLFDNNYNIKYKIGIYEHTDYPINLKYNKLKNNENINNVLEFLGSHEIIITNSYHGVYWSQLLNKKVLYYIDNNIVNYKFLNMKYRVEICNEKNYLEKVNSELSYPINLLNESRLKNDLFYKKVINEIEDLQNKKIENNETFNIDIDYNKNKIFITSNKNIKAQVTFYYLRNNTYEHIYDTITNFNKNIKYFYTFYNKNINDLSVLKIIIKMENNSQIFIKNL